MMATLLGRMGRGCAERRGADSTSKTRGSRSTNSWLLEILIGLRWSGMSITIDRFDGGLVFGDAIGFLFSGPTCLSLLKAGKMRVRLGLLWRRAAVEIARGLGGTGDAVGIQFLGGDDEIGFGGMVLVGGEFRVEPLRAYAGRVLIAGVMRDKSVVGDVEGEIA